MAFLVMNAKKISFILNCISKTLNDESQGLCVKHRFCRTDTFPSVPSKGIGPLTLELRNHRSLTCFSLFFQGKTTTTTTTTTTRTTIG